MFQPRLLPRPPQTQALSSTTFKPPPLDGTLTIAQIYDWHFQNTPFHRLFVYAREDGSTRDIHWPEAAQAIYEGARILRDRFKWTVGEAHTPVVAILSSSDPLQYFVLFMSCLRANYIPFTISPRNSSAAVAHLISSTGVDHLVIGHEPAMADLAKAALQILKDDHPDKSAPDVTYVPLFEDFFLPEPSTSCEDGALAYEYKGPDAVSCILHSSGSTAFPKPIYWTNHQMLGLALVPWFGERDLTGQILSLHSMPMYHSMGVLQAIWSASCGLVLSGFEPKSPPTIPTPDNLFNAAKATQSDIILCVPSFIEAWVNRPEYIKWLATRSGVLCGGGPLNQEAGDYMASQGVSIFNFYGSTEGGIMSRVLPAHVGYDWAYFKFPEMVTPEMVARDNNTFELVIVANDVCRPSILNTRIRGIDAYATSDLLVPHPTKPGYWKVFGRTDDQIMHSTGEKTNPGPLENILNQDPHVQSAIMFGRGRFQAGVLVDPKDAFKFDPSDENKLAEFRNLIWPTVTRMNNFAPQHSRLFKEMVLVSKPTKPFTYTAKMTARRHAIIKEYDSEITELYDTVEETTQAGLLRLDAWDPLSTLEFVREVIRSVMTHSVSDDEDIFQRGCDSLQATWIRNSILHALRQSAQLDTRQDTRNFVYDHPTVARLAAFLFKLVSGMAHDADAPVLSKSDAMHAMATKYVEDFPEHKGTMEMPATKTVLVTGTTGELGSYLLAQLIGDETVSKVYACNRVSQHGKSLRDRQSLALVDRGLDVGILDSPKLVLFEGDIENPRFNLSPALYREMQESVTHIIHTAWPVDFNLALRSFEPNLKGLRNLIDFSLASPLIQPPRLLYTSSIGIFKNVPQQQRLSETHVGSATALGSGYTESKWVAEEILAKTSESTPLKTTTVRVGQLCGGINGAWNSHEWVPALVQSAKFLGCIPDDPADVSWLPVDIAAAAIVDFLDTPISAGIFHLINPRPIPWLKIARVVASELSVSLVSYADWLARLEGSRDSSDTFRALRLLQFFRSVAIHPEDDAFGFPKLDMTNALDSSSALRNSCGLKETNVKEWMRYWQEAGTL